MRHFHGYVEPIMELETDASPLPRSLFADDAHSRTRSALKSRDQLIVVKAGRWQLGRRFTFNIEPRLTFLKPSKHLIAGGRRKSVCHFHEISDFINVPAFRGRVALARITASDEKRGAHAEVKNDRGKNDE